MIRHGQAPFLECSSRGERRLSAFAARIRSQGNRSIEELYQAAKVFADGSTGLSWRDAKGRKAVNQAEVQALHAALWDDYMAENPALLRLILDASGLQDLFGQPGHCCQATELWRIRADALQKNLDINEAAPDRNPFKYSSAPSQPVSRQTASAQLGALDRD